MLLRKAPPANLAPGETVVTPGAFSPEACAAVALVEIPAVTLRSADRENPQSFSARDYSGIYPKVEGRVPRRLRPFVSALDSSYPEDYTEQSLVRTRWFRGNTGLSRGHTDVAPDYRHIAILKGEGYYCELEPGVRDGEYDKTVVKTGDVITANNSIVELKRRHRLMPVTNMLILVAGRLPVSVLTELAQLGTEDVSPYVRLGEISVAA